MKIIHCGVRDRNKSTIFIFVGMRKGALLVFSFLLIHACGLAQTGPGGVGNSANNALWLRADKGVSTSVSGQPVSQWSDVSGNNNHVSQSTAAQQPLFITNAINGYPTLQFDFNNSSGQNDFLSGADDSSLDNTAGLAIFAVIRVTNTGSARSIIAKRTDVGVNQAYMFFFFNSNYLYVDIASNDQRFNTSPVAFGANADYLLSMHYDGTQVASQRARVYQGENLLVTSTESASSLIDYTSPLIIGATHVGDPRAFGGHMAEIILYRQALTSTQRILVNNYLSARYNIAPGANDLYTMDNTTNGDFDHDVAGIGRISATDLSNDGQGTGIVRINNATGLGNGEFMLWGHNNALDQASETIDVPPGVAARFEREWRVSEVNTSGTAIDVGAVNITWDLSAYTPTLAGDLRMLVDTDGDGLFADETPITGATAGGGGLFTFSGVTALTNGCRFTLATTNKTQTPLPVTLLKFSAQADDQNGSVDLRWSTAAEYNHAKFEVQRTADGKNWEVLHEVPGQGNTNHHKLYSFTDYAPVEGISYYRLRQIDHDGRFVYSDIRSVSIVAPGQLKLYPNPAEYRVTLEGVTENIQIQCFDLSGRDLSSSIGVTRGDKVLQVDVSALLPGLYYLKAGNRTVLLVRK